MSIQHEIRLQRPDEISVQEWGILHAMSISAYSTVLRRSPQEVTHFTQADDFGAFYAQKNDPNTRADCPEHSISFYDPRIAIAYHADRPVGYAFAANQTQAVTQIERNHRYRNLKTRNFWLGELIVDPLHTASQQQQASIEMPRERVGLMLAKMIVMCANRVQPVVTTIFPEEYKDTRRARSLQSYVERLGFEPVNTTMVKAFGDDTERAKRIDMRAGWAWGVQYNLTQLSPLAHF